MRAVAGNVGDDDLRQVAQKKLEGYNHLEIADLFGCAPETIQRRLARIRDKWGHAFGDGSSLEFTL
jgi:DNA-directed RNA polymerase specialized sigma24 family protein